MKFFNKRKPSKPNWLIRKLYFNEGKKSKPNWLIRKLYFNEGKKPKPNWLLRKLYFNEGKKPKPNWLVQKLYFNEGKKSKPNWLQKLFSNEGKKLTVRKPNWLLQKLFLEKRKELKPNWLVQKLFFNEGKKLIDRKPNWLIQKLNESIRIEQLLTFAVAIIYCFSIFFDNFIIRIPFTYFAISILVVGIGYIISSYKSKFKYQYITIGVLWIFVGIISRIYFNYKFAGIPIAIIGSSTGYFLIMCIIAITVIQRRNEYINNFAYFVVVLFAFGMAITHVFTFFGIVTYMQYFSFSNIFIPIGHMVIRLSRYSIIEFMSMLVVILSILFQAPRHFVLRGSYTNLY